MEKITKYFTTDYDNDTTIEYVNTGLYSMLNCSFTSEDPDYGTDTIHFAEKSEEQMENIAYDMLQEIRNFLDYRDGTTSSDPQRLTLKYDQFSNSTLIAIERALQEITKDYRPDKWFATLEDAARDVACRMINDGKKDFAFCESNEEEQKLYTPTEYEKFGAEWYGIKRLPSLFDNGDYEYLVGIGYYGGGDFASAYMYDEGRNAELAVTELGRSICDAVEELTGLKPQSIVFVTEEKEDE